MDLKTGQPEDSTLTSFVYIFCLISIHPWSEIQVFLTFGLNKKVFFSSQSHRGFPFFLTYFKMLLVGIDSEHFFKFELKLKIPRLKFI